MSIDGHVTVGDLDIDVDEEETDTHSFEIGTRAGYVIMADEEAARLPETLSVEAALVLADELQYAADHAAQYKREQEQDQAAADGNGGDA